MHELTDEVAIQKLANQHFLLEGKIDLDGKLVETIMPCKDIEAFENYSEAIDEHYDKRPKIIKEADIFIDTDGKIFNKVERSVYGKGSTNINEKIVRYEGKNWLIQPGGQICFHRCEGFHPNLLLAKQLYLLKNLNKKMFTL